MEVEFEEENGRGGEEEKRRGGEEEKRGWGELQFARTVSINDTNVETRLIASRNILRLIPIFSIEDIVKGKCNDMIERGWGELQFARTGEIMKIKKGQR